MNMISAAWFPSPGTARVRVFDSSHRVQVEIHGLEPQILHLTRLVMVDSLLHEAANAFTTAPSAVASADRRPAGVDA